MPPVFLGNPVCLVPYGSIETYGSIEIFMSHDCLGDSVVPRKGKGHGLKIFQRFHFSSALKRMSVIAGYTPPGSTDVDYIVTVKGAPEILKDMVS